MQVMCCRLSLDALYLPCAGGQRGGTIQGGCLPGAAKEVALLACFVCSPRALHRECVLGMLSALQQCAPSISV